MTILAEPAASAGFIVSEANHTRSRAQITIKASQTLVPGAVLGALSDGSGYIELDPDAATGAEVAAAVLFDHAVTGVGVTLQATALVRDAEVIDGLLVFSAGVDSTERGVAVGELAAIGIIVRPDYIV
jgi:hypothetical protein